MHEDDSVETAVNEQAPGRQPSDPSSDRAVGATLESLVADLGIGLLRVSAAPDGLAVPVAQVVIHDPAAPLEVESGDLILGVGIRADHHRAGEVVEAAGAADAAAVALKSGDGAPPALKELAEASGVALLAVTPEVTWAQLHTLLRTAMVQAGQAPEGPSGIRAPLGDLFALANAVAAMVGGPTTIEDPQSRVLAYSSDEQPIDEGRRQTILGRRVPEPYIERLNELGVFRQLWSTEDVVRVDGIESPEGESLRPRLATAVRAGDEILGSIWVAEGDTPLGDSAVEALRQAAQIAALHLVRHRAGDDIERRMRGELLRSLLEGRGPLSVLADRLDLDPDSAYTVVAFELQSNEEAEMALQRERASQLVSLYCEAFRRQAVQTAVGRTIYALLPLSEPPSAEGPVRLANDVLERGGQVLAVDLLVALSTVVDHLREVPRARSETDQVLRVLAGDPQGRVIATFDDVRPQALLLELRDLAAERPHLLTGRVDLLFEEDADGPGIYVDTLRAYLDSFGDIPAAARSLDVHPNTFRYRIRRVAEISGIDLDDPEERLAAELQLRLR